MAQLIYLQHSENKDPPLREVGVWLCADTGSDPQFGGELMKIYSVFPRHFVFFHCQDLHMSHEQTWPSCSFVPPVKYCCAMFIMDK